MNEELTVFHTGKGVQTKYVMSMLEIKTRIYVRALHEFVYYYVCSQTVNPIEKLR